MSVAASQRFTKNQPCPICGGSLNMPRGHKQRCFGFISDDGNWVNCSREEYAGGLPINEKSSTFAHKMFGRCGCGIEHGPDLPPIFKFEDYQTTNKNQPQNNTEKEKPSKAGPAEKPVILETYDYISEHGEFLYQAVRFNPKDFRQRRRPRPDDDQSKIKYGWVWTLDNTEIVLYHLPQLMQADLKTPVHLVEGEKDVHTLEQMGYVATCNPMGARKWRKEFNSYLFGRDLVIHQDNDTEGEAHTKVLLENLYSSARSVKVVTYEDMPLKSDVSDWLAAGHTLAELEAKINSSRSTNPGEPVEKHRFHADELNEIPPVEWLLEPYLQRNCLALLIGESEAGKTFVGIHFALSVAQTENVLYIACEDSGQYPDRVTAWRQYHRPAQCNFWLETMDLSLMDSPNVNRMIEANKDIAPTLVVIDTLHAASETADENSGHDMGIILAHARKIQSTWNSTVLIVHHLNKAGLAERGHSSLKAGMRTVLRLSSDGDGVKLEFNKVRMGPKPEPVWFAWKQVGNSRIPITTNGTTVDRAKFSANDLIILKHLAGELERDESHNNKDLLTALAIPERTMSYCLKKLKSMGLLSQPRDKGPWKITPQGILAAKENKPRDNFDFGSKAEGNLF